MKTLSRVHLNDQLATELKRHLPAKDLPQPASIQSLLEVFLTLRNGDHPTILTLRREGVEAEDISKEINLGPAVKVLFQVRQQVMELAFVSQNTSPERGSSGRIAKVVTSPTVSEAAPLNREATTSFVTAMLGQLASHERVGEIPETLVEVLRERLSAFCQKDAANERFEMPEMLWARLQPKDQKWVVKVEKKMGEVAMELSLTKIEKYNVKALPTEHGKKKEVKEDVGYLRVDFSKWKETAPTEGNGQ